MYSRRSVAFSNRGRLCVATSNHHAWPLMRMRRFSAAPRSARTAANLRVKIDRIHVSPSQLLNGSTTQRLNFFFSFQFSAVRVLLSPLNFSTTQPLNLVERYDPNLTPILFRAREAE